MGKNFYTFLQIFPKNFSKIGQQLHYYNNLTHCNRNYQEYKAI